ncbi:IS481 family insertion sequence transposase domain-containing protein (plasmid) [Rhizobium sp. N6212]|nr:IS481 family insertion sequence transposase domain-containing protein [Rhizobium sp. N6212]ANL01541.1 IS481 family insertion sequence transposase domain-containing protein [Rhizobium sp. N621]ANL07669.1 IS481 family insertion sequence transposase domain-containing protein [Rhizobium esperanzae]ANL13839.1 IS481 family insertion sequence transposase domain-containing protein [Rhizobium sp. N1341]ANM38510.1 IS481 family insertion sequence transposase domain-containing protein [Rhizobium sp. N87
MIAAVPYKIHTVLTDNGIQFTTPGAGGSAVPLIKEAIANGERFWAHAFEYTCATNDIEHRTTKVKHPWTNGQVERMNRTIKDATVRRFYYESHDQLRQHLADFVAAYNFGRRLKTLKGLTPYEFICKAWASQPERSTLDPLQQMPGLNKTRTSDARLPIRRRLATIYIGVFSSQKSFRPVAPEALRPSHPRSSDPRYGAMEGRDRRNSLSLTESTSSGLSETT